MILSFQPDLDPVAGNLVACAPPTTTACYDTPFGDAVRRNHPTSRKRGGPIPNPWSESALGRPAHSSETDWGRG